MKKYVIFIFIVIELSSFAQKSPNQNINLSVGIGNPAGNPIYIDTYGLTYSIGYERQILKEIISKDMLRINSNLNFGHYYSEKSSINLKKARANSYILNIRLNIDLLEINYFSLFVSGGAFYGIRNEYLEKITAPHFENTSNSRSESFGGLYGYGFRYYSSKNKWGFNIVSTKYLDSFNENNIMLGVEYKL